MGTTDGEVVDDGQRLAQARTALRAERRRTAEEIQALRSFETRVREVETTSRVAGGRPAARASVVAGGPDGLGAVRDAYEATVMAVPHYESEYDDSYVESLAAEFSRDLAAALTDGTLFNAVCKDALLSAVDGARSVRGRFLELLTAESDSLEAAAETLTPVSAELSDLEDRAVGTAPYGMLDAYGARLAVLERTCETVAETRQATLFEQRRTSGLPTDAPDVPQYVYQTLPFDYPVMATVADCSAAIRRIRDDVDAAMDAAGPDRKRVE
jgi:hypothetical protein